MEVVIVYRSPTTTCELYQVCVCVQAEFWSSVANFFGALTTKIEPLYSGPLDLSFNRHTSV